MNCYTEFFRFAPHAHFVAFIVHIAALMETRSDTINLAKLVKEIESSNLVTRDELDEIKRLLVLAEPIRKKTKILRDNLFAHRNAALSNAAAFEKAEIIPDELRDLTETALKIVNRLLVARGHDIYDFDSDAINHAKAMMSALSQTPLREPA